MPGNRGGTRQGRVPHPFRLRAFGGGVGAASRAFEIAARCPANEKGMEPRPHPRHLIQSLRADRRDQASCKLTALGPRSSAWISNATFWPSEM